MDVLDGVPHDLLGYEIKTRTRIILTCLVPAIFELLVYIVVMSADVILATRYFTNNDKIWAILTMMLIVAPSIICFTTFMSNPTQWPEMIGCDIETLKFCSRNLFNLFLFPIGAICRFCRRIFWSVESLFHEKSSNERQHAVSKAAETSSYELYHFLQAFTQAAPQIILQLYVLLREDTFRDYETTTAQIISIIFSFITMATIVMSYQRFESQKIVGRSYPWSTSEQVQLKTRMLKRTTSTPEEVLCAKTISAHENMVPNIMQNFHARYSEADDTVDSKAESSTVSFRQNIEEIEDFLRKTGDDIEEDVYDQVPKTPAPPTPKTVMQFFNERFSTYKDMLMLNAEMVMKEHIPRLPERVFESRKDETDTFQMPSRKKMLEGLEQDNFVGKSVAFTGWIMFLFMRMFSLSTFSVFYLQECAYLCLSHYFSMLFCIFVCEKKFHEKLERIYFYIFLGYVYVFTLLEFKIKFSHVRRWYISYFVFVFVQSIVITNLWYHLGKFESWWFHYMYFTIHGGGALSLMCLLFYYYVLKPKDKVLYIN